MKIIQITDTHLKPAGMTNYGLDPAARLRAVVADIVAQHRDAALVVLTGDLCDHGDPSSYALLAEILSAIPSAVRLLLGNHDRRPEFIAAFPEHPRDDNGYIQYLIDTVHGRLLFLDTHAAGVIGGIYDDDRLDWLERALLSAGDQPVTVFLHHPPMPLGIRHFARIGLHDDGRLMRRLSAHPAGLRHIVFGHIHMPLSGVTAEGIAYSSGQACAQQLIVAPEQHEPYWTDGEPGYRILMIDDLGFRAFSVTVGMRELARSNFCEGP